MNDDTEISYEEMDEKEGEELTEKDKLGKLRLELKACQSERQEYLEGWQRSKADFVNARKNHEREKEDLARYATEGVLADIVDVLDTFDLAFSHKESWEKVDRNWRLGVESIHAKLLGTLLSHGLREIEIKTGDPFDPNRHQSVKAEPTSDKAMDDTIARVIQKGYQLGDRVMRPAKVVVLHYEDAAQGSEDSK